MVLMMTKWRMMKRKLNAERPDKKEYGGGKAGIKK